jgi:hypothetical protein
MENTQTNGNKNGAKRRWKRPKEKKKYTADEMELIRTSRAVMKVIEKQIERGDFDEYFEREGLKK